MSDKLVTIASFDNPAEAYAAKYRLEAEGIQAYVADETVGNWLPIGAAVGGIKLQVAERDAQRSDQILSLQEPLEEGEAQPPSWRCRKCQEIVDAGFDVCWSCGQAWEETHDPDFVAGQSPTVGTATGENDFADVALHGATSAAEPEAGEADRSNPYYSSRRAAEASAASEASAAAASEELEATVTRAWRAAVIGIVACPFVFLVNLYSIYLLLRVAASEGELSSPGKWKCRGAWALNLIEVLIFLYLLRAAGLWG